MNKIQQEQIKRALRILSRDEVDEISKKACLRVLNDEVDAIISRDLELDRLLKSCIPLLEYVQNSQGFNSEVLKKLKEHVEL